MTYYIMQAAHIAPHKQKVSIAKIAREQQNCTVLIATRHYGFNKSNQIFIIGSGQGGYDNQCSTYTIDTGMGHRYIDNSLNIDGSFQIDQHGNIHSATCDLSTLNARSVYVMK